MMNEKYKYLNKKEKSEIGRAIVGGLIVNGSSCLSDFGIDNCEDGLDAINIHCAESNSDITRLMCEVDIDSLFYSTIDNKLCTSGTTQEIFDSFLDGYYEDEIKFVRVYG